MKTEEIAKVSIRENGEMFLILRSGGKPSYQYIYREAAEVYWDADEKGFKAPAPRTWDHHKWFLHIEQLVASSLGVDLLLTEETGWENVPTELREKLTTRNT